MKSMFVELVHKNLKKMLCNKLFITTLLAVLIIAIMGEYYYPMLPKGELQQFDEYYTLERSHAFLVKNDWLSVYSNYSPNFKKPPLQYWLTAYTLAKSNDLEYALRLWPFIFGLSLLLTTGFLAYVINPTKPFVIPIACLILSGFPMLWEYAISAMLETGAAFFLTLTIAGAILAIRKPNGWFFVAIIIWLATLQKSILAVFCLPVIFFAIYLTRKEHDIKLDVIFSNKKFRYATIMGSILVILWPLIQLFRFGPRALGRMIQENSRFVPVSSLSDVKLQFFQWIWQDAFGLWVLGLISLVMLPRFLKKPEVIALQMFVFIFIIFIIIASGSIYPRYLLLITPMLSASLAVTIVHIFSSFSLRIACAFILIFILGTPFKENVVVSQSTQNRYKPVLTRFSKALKDNELPIFCKWGPQKNEIFPGALSYYESPLIL